ncbi:PQQ-dependent sugar dehydrogenase [Flavitalea antarctica]
MKNPFILAFALSLCSFAAFSQEFNNDCASPTTVSVGATCTPTQGSLYKATNVSITGSCATEADIWFRFQVPAFSSTVEIAVDIPATSGSLSTSNTFVELFNATGCPAANSSLGCGNTTGPRRFTGLTAGQVYLFRIYTTQSTNGNASNFVLNVCVTSNDDCAGAINLVAGTQADGNLFGARTNSATPAGCATADTDDDVWYKFTAVANMETVAVSNAGADLTTAGVRMQLFSGNCGSLVSVGCANSSIDVSALTPGNTYYVRVYSAGSAQLAASTFKILLSTTPPPPTLVTVVGSRMGEVFSQHILSPANVLNDPWEVTYGPDNNLWVTEAKGYKVSKINPTTGVKEIVLDISQGSTFLPLADRTFNCQFANGSGAQGGCAGLALHPNFLHPTNPKNYVYVSYVHSQTSTNVFTNRVVRFEYNTTTGKLELPVSLCDTLPGSNDHNSQRMIIAPVGGINYLFYASGDMGSGQFGNASRPIRAQLPRSSEGKILRFNLEPDGDAGAYDQWIPSTGTGDATNPYNATLGVQSATWAIGIRNNQGFAYDAVLNKLYGSSHGPFSDDEINVIERQKNYGHPLVIGYAGDRNVEGTTAGAAPGMNPSSGVCPVITDEVAAAAALPNYRDPLFSAYPNSIRFPSIGGLWNEIPISNNGLWPSEGWSGLDFYNHTAIPGWKRSLIASSLKWGRLVKIRLDKTGDSTYYKSKADSTSKKDTVSYFGSQNRFRDIAIGPTGKDLYVVMDKSTTSSGPSSAFPVVPSCPGCLQKYTFLGYRDVSGQSSIDTIVPVSDGVPDACNTGTGVTIDYTNNMLWVPLTGPDGNIIAEIFPNGQNLGTITSSFYKNSGPLRMRNGSTYADRNITITPQNQPASPVKVRIYLSKKEYDAFDANPLSGITSLADLRIHKNSDPCQSAIAAATSIINPALKLKHNDSGYVLQADISGFSTFYIGSTSALLPLTSLNFQGRYKDGTAYLNWETSNESNTKHFDVERNTGDGTYTNIGTVAAKGTESGKTRYTLNDNEASGLGTSRLFYRLKITDKDGSYTYSNVVVLDIPGTFITRISVFPNPADKQTTVMISSPEEQKVTMQLVDVTGRSVINRTVVLKKGENRLSIDLNALRTGVYFLQVKGQFVNAQEKIQKL